MALQLRSKPKTLINPTFLHLFSSSSSSINDENLEKDSSSSSSSSSSSTTSTTTSSSSYFSDVKASLRQNPPHRRRLFPSPPPQFPSPKPSQVASFEEIRKNLTEFRRRSAPPPSESSNSPSPKPIFLQELYKSNLVGTTDTSNAKSGRLPFESIRQSLRQLRSPSGTEQPPGPNNRFRSPDKGNQTLSPFSLKAFQDNLKQHPPGGSGPSSSFLGSLESVPDSIFGKEVEEKSESEVQGMKTEFLKVYSYGELGEKLRMLRPGVRKGDKNWFSFGELNQRLAKLKVIEAKEMESRIGGGTFKELRESLVKLKISKDSTAKKSSMQRLAMLGQLGGEVAPAYKSLPPKDQLVEKYFHPDNMSSEEKLKLELKRVRDEFKMSESDCGSSRVQVAQLTTKIKHLSSVLHKKDKHSRKGLVAMVQRRKKLLKYLRRTDWDSYCFVLSKLGLRDNPDYKN